MTRPSPTTPRPYSANPNDAKLYVVPRRSLCQKWRKYDKAIADYGEAIRLDPKDAKLHLYRGGVFARKGDFDKANADVKAAIALDPKNEEARRPERLDQATGSQEGKGLRTVPQTQQRKHDIEFQNLGDMLK